MRPDAFDIRERQRRHDVRGATPLRVTNIKKGSLKRILASILILLMVYAGSDHGWQLYETMTQQRIRYVKLEGVLNNVQEHEIKRTFAEFMNESLIVVNLEKVQSALESHPWIRHVELRRQWPDSMIIDVTEERAIARWGSNALLNQEGKVFTPANISGHEHLPVLIGPSGTEREVMEQYQKFNQILYLKGIKMTGLEMSARGSWEITLDNEVVVKVGKRNVMDRIRRFVTLSDVIFDGAIDSAATIDLRYSNGIAISRQVSEPENLARN
jgi:cell division protein FtsQ